MIASCHLDEIGAQCLRAIHRDGAGAFVRVWLPGVRGVRQESRRLVAHGPAGTIIRRHHERGAALVEFDAAALLAALARSGPSASH